MIDLWCQDRQTHPCGIPRARQETLPWTLNNILYLYSCYTVCLVQMHTLALYSTGKSSCTQRFYKPYTSLGLEEEKKLFFSIKSFIWMKTTAWNKGAEAPESAKILSTIGGDGSAAHTQCSLSDTEKDWTFLHQIWSLGRETHPWIWRLKISVLKVSVHALL